jgi:hypothetical protein
MAISKKIRLRLKLFNYSERAQERRAAMTSRELGYELAFLPRLYAQPLEFAGPLESEAIARDRRGSLLGHSAVNNPL